jgi:hypothetical protein
MVERPTLAMDGFSKIKPLTEGSVAKGGVNNTSQITVRPPAPAVLKPAKAASSAKPQR